MIEMKTKHIFSAIVIIYSALFFLIPHTDYNPADAGLKVLQVKDFIKQDYRSFTAVYNGNQLDPGKKFFPVKPNAAHKVGNDMYYTHPFLITMINTPVYKLFGIYGIILICMMSGLLTIVVSVQIARLLNMREETVSWMLVFLGFASIIPLYSYLVSEYNLSLFLVTFSVYLVLLGKERNNAWSYVAAGLSAGISVFLRIELGLFCVLLFLGVIIFKIYRKPGRQITALFASLLVCAIVLVGLNYHIYGNILGLRGIEFLSNAGTGYSASNRLLSLFSGLFFSNEKIGLFVAWPIFLFLFALLSRQNWKEVSSDRVTFMLFIILIFGLSIPIIISNKDGSIIGPRFVAPIQPLLIIMTFKLLEIKKMQIRRNVIISRILIGYSIIIVMIGIFILVRFDQISQDVTSKIAGYSKNKVVILCDHTLRNSTYQLFQERIIFAIDPSKDWDAILEKTKKAGFNELTVIDYANNKKAIEYPFKTSRYEVVDRHFYHGSFKNTIVENIKIID